MRTQTRSVLMGVVLAALVFAAACGSDAEDVVSGGPSTSDPDTAVSLTGTTDDATTGDTSGEHWTRIEPRDDLVNPTVAEPTALLADPDDDQRVLVRFYGGVQDCYGARATVVREDDSVVKIRLEVGSVPGSADRACIEIAEAQELAVGLDAPLGDRRLTPVPAP